MASSNQKQDNSFYLLGEIIENQKKMIKPTESLAKDVETIKSNTSNNNSNNDQMMAIIIEQLNRLFEGVKEAAMNAKAAAQIQIPLPPPCKFRPAPVNYKYVLWRELTGKWVVLGMTVFVLFLLCGLYMHQTDNNYRLKIREIENNRFEDAWKLLYNQQTPAVQKTMDRAYGDAMHKRLIEPIKKTEEK